MADAPTTARARARVAMTADIKAVAHRQLVELGPAGLSLRAVARELGVVSSAVYRYVASRDELVTLLIIDAYDAVGEVAERAAADGRGGFEARWVRLCRAIRAWAVANPHDHALVYGSPVPGYRAPVDTVAPAMRVTRAAVGIVVAGVEAGEVAVGSDGPVPRPVHADLAVLRAGLEVELDDAVTSRMLAAWTWLFGHLGFELFGHLEGGIADYDAFFDHQAARVGRQLAGR